jgi:AraC family transcriptional regulator of adaptative response/methylated-DNA-[protein]-cysteine methyltransferase
MPNDRTGNIVYCNLDSPLGDMIAGATPRGICFLEWHDRGGVERIQQRVGKRYRSELVAGENEHLKSLRRELTAYFEGKLTQFATQIDVTGTKFEMVVWNELLKIPCGETRSYGQMAKMIGNPGASRAVGRANGANYLAVVIPCHRVIDSNGNLHGYGGGVWRKKWLLELEASDYGAKLSLNL